VILAAMILELESRPGGSLLQEIILVGAAMVFFVGAVVSAAMV